jgi:glycosyltransferase involved in cell wall biosynthesis
MHAVATLDAGPPDTIAAPPRIGVAHLIHTMAHGGVETALINWMKTFDPDRVAAHLLVFANPGGSEQPFVEATRRAGLPVHYVPWGRLKPVWRAARVTADLLRQLNVDILHCHNAYADAVGLLAARDVPVKTVTTMYVWSKVGFKRRVLQHLDQRLIPHFDQVTAHCEAALRGTVERGIPAEKIRLLTCGFADRTARLSAFERDALRESLGVPRGEMVLINVARFWPEKRHDVLLRAFQQLLHRRQAVRLWIPGVGPEEGRIRSLASRLGLNGHVSFLGFRTDLPELLAAADVQVHTSDEEGVPLAILSGMAAGLPIVATRVGGIAEVLRHEWSGVLVPRRDPLRLAIVLDELIADPLRRRVLGNNAQRFLTEEYSLEAATRRVETLYREVLGR